LSLMTKDVQHLFMGTFATYIFSLVKYANLLSQLCYFCHEVVLLLKEKFWIDNTCTWLKIQSDLNHSSGNAHHPINSFILPQWETTFINFLQSFLMSIKIHIPISSPLLH
jgi:hypothetical protein